MARRRISTEETQQLRQRIAREAARLIARGKVRNFHTARMRAMRWLSQQKLTSAQVPTQEEVMQELDRITSVSDAYRDEGLQYLIDEVASLLKLFKPLLYIDGQAMQSRDTPLCHWIVSGYKHNAQASEPTDPAIHSLALRACLDSSHSKLEPIEPPDWATDSYQFSNGIGHQIYLDPTLESTDQITRELKGQNVTFHERNVQTASELDETSEELSWSDTFRPLLERLESFHWDYAEHPEGDALYHSLQVYDLGRNLHPYDVEFQWACLLHDVGFVVDPRLPEEAALRVLSGRVTERVEFLVGNLSSAHRFLKHETQAKSLRKSESFEELLDLARCDRDGRQPGKVVPTLEEALEQLESLEEDWSDEPAE
ncbi:hypothetical protein [Rubinisphaera italica]|uniref:HD domain-containing protein n=1 Tax=Rubinisphaera italica TaxID=2527969 RepID=A0A5C5XLM6_9PLAN|nr:hypothetical protein [Rubinisphaera italica]TWT63045.1 hypothetical protein Pan54_37960 [Rubinisphaera italica]